jgi:hypothetical protein
MLFNAKSEPFCLIFINLRIPVKSATHSGRSRPPVPEDLGR